MLRSVSSCGVHSNAAQRLQHLTTQPPDNLNVPF